jgi:hypothetical protein
MRILLLLVCPVLGGIAAYLGIGYLAYREIRREHEASRDDY